MNDTPAYSHRYHQSLVYKLFLADKLGTDVRITFAQALDIIRELAEFTHGMPQIAYLVGWQFDGHDSKYPAWSEVNERLKRPEDATALDSLRWLMREARQYNTTVSIHINMCDAYENSPLWDEYVSKDLLIRNEDGSLKKGALWGGEQSYLVCKKREWESGLAHRRIDALLEMLPLAEAGTVHIDVFAPRLDPFHGVSLADDTAVLIQILAYWRSHGIDVTKEWFHHELAGLVPMVIHLNLDEASRLKYAPGVICGGGPQWNRRNYRFYEAINWGAMFGAPEAGCLHEEAWGISVDVDIFYLKDVPRFRSELCRYTIPWLYLNLGRPVTHVHTAERYEVIFDTGVRSYIEDGRHVIEDADGRRLKQGDDYCLPAVWLRDRWVAYSRTGGRRDWVLPADWGKVRVGDAANREEHAVVDGRLTLEMSAEQPVWIERIN